MVTALNPVIVYDPDEALTVIPPDGSQWDPPSIEYQSLEMVILEFHDTVNDVSVLDLRD